MLHSTGHSLCWPRSHVKLLLLGTFPLCVLCAALAVRRHQSCREQHAHAAAAEGRGTPPPPAAGADSPHALGAPNTGYSSAEGGAMGTMGRILPGLRTSQGELVDTLKRSGFVKSERVESCLRSVDRRKFLSDFQATAYEVYQVGQRRLAGRRCGREWPVASVEARQQIVAERLSLALASFPYRFVRWNTAYAGRSFTNRAGSNYISTSYARNGFGIAGALPAK